MYVQVLYTSQQPRQVKIGVSLPSDATISELRDVLESDTSIARANMLLTEICDEGFLRTFSDTQQVSVITEADPIYCIEVPQLKDASEETTSAYVLLCWINVLVTEKGAEKFGKFPLLSFYYWISKCQTMYNNFLSFCGATRCFFSF